VRDLANPGLVNLIRYRLSADRFVSYDRQAGGDRVASLRLYEWNTAASAACYATLQAVEIVLRNAINQQLTKLHSAQSLPGSWLDDPTHVLDPHRLADIADARRRVRRNGRPPTPGRLIPELPFGFWRFLLAGRYEQTLWTPALRHAFPYLQPRRRRDIAAPVDRLHQLRNRIAHHEPIHYRDLAADHADMLAVVAAVCPDTHAWVSRISTIAQAIAQRPGRGQTVALPAPRPGTPVAPTRRGA
jgi:hypothetical protein